MEKEKVINILNEIGTLLQLKGENFFKTKAYFEGSRILEMINDDLEDLIKNDRLKDIKGIGKALNQKITELVTTGQLNYYDQLKAEIPAGLLEMLKVPNLGTKKVKVIYDELGITSIEELERACEDNRLLTLNGFAKKTQEKILENIKSMKEYREQTLYAEAEHIAQDIAQALKDNNDVIRIEVCGSIRRKKEVVKDVDILISSKSNEPMNIFKTHPLVAKVVNDGPTKISVLLVNGMNADLRIVSDEEFPYALHHFTGSKEHNTKMRHISKQMGIKMNEYGLFKGEELISCKDEKDIFNYLKMDYIPPELRENAGEIESAQSNSLPELIKDVDIKGVIHSHSKYSDGHNSIEELVNYCIIRGYNYLAVSDHSKSAFYANGLSDDDIKRQHEEIDNINVKYKGKFKVLKSIELEILQDGSIDYNEEILRMFDFRIASIHSSWNMPEDKMTDRIIKAMKSKYVNILAHPTGRKLLQREAFKLNVNEVIKAAKDLNVVLEINSCPERLDLDWRYVIQAKKIGCKFVISADAHSYNGIDNTIYGVNVARKGWLERCDVLNTLSGDEFLNYFSFTP